MKCLKDLNTMQLTFLQKLFDDLGDDFESFNIKAHDLKSRIIGKFNFDINFKIERTAAYNCSNYLYNILDNRFPERVILFSEVTLDLLSKISSTTASGILSIVEHTKPADITIGTRKIPDVLAEVIFGATSCYTFIEYKVNDVFKYLDLAGDLIKYLIYTNKSKLKTYFMYIVFTKSDFLTLKPSGNVICQILEENVTASNVNDAANIFLYDSCAEDNENKARNEKELEQRFIAMSKIMDTLEEINVLGLNPDDIMQTINYEHNDFYKNKHKFASNVITANIIKDNFVIFKELDDLIRSDNITFDIDSESPIILEKYKTDNVDKDSFSKATAQYFNNQLHYNLDEIKNQIEVEAVKTSLGRSDWILSIIIAFIRMNSLEMVSSKSNVIELSENLYKSVNLIVEKYDNSFSRAKLNGLALSLLYYITKLYEIIFDFDIETNEIKSKKKYLSYKKKVDLKAKLEEAIKVFSGRRRKASLVWDFNVTELGKKLLEDILVNNSQ